MVFKKLSFFNKTKSSESKTLFDKSLSGVHVIDKDKISPGYNLYEGILMDENGKQIKKWDFKYLGVIDNQGDYYAQEFYESKRWGKFDWEGNPLWISDIPIHHDIVLSKDKIITFTKEMHEYKGRKVDFCVILELNNDGKVLHRWSTWDNLEYLKKFHSPLELERPYAFFIKETAKRKDRTPWGGNYDYYRLNSLQIIPENNLGKKDKRFQKGNWLISFRHGSMILILDKDSKEVVWKCIFQDVKGNIEGPHCPKMLKNGNIILFDNGRYRGYSRIIKINPTDFSVVWEYQNPNPTDFFTKSQGYLQILPNNNLLITESEKGHVFELTPEKEIVWEFYHPEAQNETNSKYKESYGSRQWIYRMTRYPKPIINNIIKNNL